MFNPIIIEAETKSKQSLGLSEPGTKRSSTQDIQGHSEELQSREKLC